MPTIPLHKRNGRVVAEAIVDQDDYDNLSEHTWRLDSCGYARRNATVDGKVVTIRMHRIVAGLPHGIGFSSGVVDHLNGDKLDNRKSNLRITTTGANIQRGSFKVGRSGFRGVIHHQGKYLASTTFLRKKIYLGVFDSAIDAAKAYNDAVIRLHGDMAKINSFQEHDFIQAVV